MRHYTQREIRDIFFADVPGKTLVAWGRVGLVEWVDVKEDARGIHRQYSLWNLYQIGVVRELAALGIPHDMIRPIIDTYFKVALPDDPRLSMVRSMTPQEQVMDRMLVLLKNQLGRRDLVWVRPGTFALVEPGEIGQFLKEHNYPPGVVLVSLPWVAREIQDKAARFGAT